MPQDFGSIFVLNGAKLKLAGITSLFKKVRMPDEIDAMDDQFSELLCRYQSRHAAEVLGTRSRVISPSAWNAQR